MSAICDNCDDPAVYKTFEDGDVCRDCAAICDNCDTIYPASDYELHKVDDLGNICDDCYEAEVEE